MDGARNLIIEHLKKIQAEQSAAREREREMLQRLSRVASNIERRLKIDG